MAMSSTVSVKSLKRILRKEIREKLLQLTQDQIDLQSRTSAKTLQSLPVYQTSKHIGLYMHMDNLEINTLEIIKQCFHDGKQVYLPRCVQIDSSLSTGDHFTKQYIRSSILIFHQLNSFQDVLNLKPVGKYQLKEPSSGTDLFNVRSHGGLDILIVPGVAFDKQRFRLGHGAGYYDDYIKRHRLHFNKTPVTIGISLNEQLVTDVPHEDHDEQLDSLIVGPQFFTKQ